MLMKIDIGYRYYLIDVPAEFVGTFMSILGQAREAEYEYVSSGPNLWFIKEDGSGINIGMFNESLCDEQDVHTARREKELKDLKEENERLRKKLEEVPDNTMGIAA